MYKALLLHLQHFTLSARCTTLEHCYKYTPVSIGNKKKSRDSEHKKTMFKGVCFFKRAIDGFLTIYVSI
jgi:hypothetical protein